MWGFGMDVGIGKEQSITGLHRSCHHVSLRFHFSCFKYESCHILAYAWISGVGFSDRGSVYVIVCPPPKVRPSAITTYLDLVSLRGCLLWGDYGMAVVYRLYDDCCGETVWWLLWGEGWSLWGDCGMAVVGRLWDDRCGETVGWLLWGDCGMIVVGRLWDDWSE